MYAAVAVVAGLALLSYSGGWLVDGAVSLARSLNVSSVVIGAVVLGFGTSAPELVVSTIAAWQGNPALGVGNIVGSNVANLTLILGSAGLITAVNLTPSVIRRQAPLSTVCLIGHRRNVEPHGRHHSERSTSRRNLVDLVEDSF